MRPFFARRRMFVHPFQYRGLAAIVSYGLLLALVVGGVVFVPLIVEFDSPGLSLEEKDRIARQFLSLHDQLWPWLAVTFLIIGVHSVCFAHRVAGPIYDSARCSSSSRKAACPYGRDCGATTISNPTPRR